MIKIMRGKTYEGEMQKAENRGFRLAVELFSNTKRTGELIDNLETWGKTIANLKQICDSLMPPVKVANESNN